MIAHRPSIVSVADKLLVLKDGVVEQFGPRQEIMKAVQPGGAPAVARLVRTGGSAP
jgi:ATP-binding cassette subfamily C protein